MPENNHLQTLPVLPVKNTVLFPYIHMPFSVGRPASLLALEATLAKDAKELVIVSQRDSSVETPGPADLYSIGTKAVIKKAVRGDDGRVQLIVLGLERVRIVHTVETEPFMEAEVEDYPLPQELTPEA